MSGGGKGGSKSSSKSGFAALPKQLQNDFGTIGEQLARWTNPARADVRSMFTPMGQTADETAAFDMMRGGFAPTAESLSSDISMQMNPYNQHVIDEINRQARGEYSLLNEAMNQAGQFGSNRTMLGANDIDLTRTGQIGQFLQGQYNTAMNNALTTIPGLRQQDAQNMMGIGSFMRGLDTSTRQAPIAALQAGTSMMTPFMSGSTSTQSSGGGGLLGGLGNIGGFLSGFNAAFPQTSASIGAAMGFSDIRLKENIVPRGEENGFPVYEFSYRGDDRRFIGVMAQDLLETRPDAVLEDDDGFLMVDYSKINVNFRSVH